MGVARYLERCLIYSHNMPMNKIQLYKDAINSFVQITNKVHDIKKQKVTRGEYVNVFSLWNEFSGITEPIHSRILNFLLSDHPMHGQGNRFIDLFLQRIGISPSPTAEWLATAEIGRVDVMLKRFSPKAVVIIENKSNWACDQENQLYRYWLEQIHHCEEDCCPKFHDEHPEYKVVYLVPNKDKELSEQSLFRPAYYPGNLPAVIPTTPIILAFDEEVQEWLADCINALPQENTPLRELISQYRKYCQTL